MCIRDSVSTGTVVARGAATVLAVECDPTLVCEHVVVDRATGDHRVVPLDLDGAILEQLGWWGPSEAIAPDGTIALVTITTSRLDPTIAGGTIQEPSFVAIDLVTGAITPIDIGVQPYWASGVTWTADSRYAFFLSEGEVLAYDRATGDVLRAGPDERSTSRPQVIAVRPSDGVPWAER